MKRTLALLVGLWLVPGLLPAQVPNIPPTEIDNTRYGGTAAQFLTLPADARGAALGGAYAALVSDVTAMFWNPAGLALLTRKEAAFTFTEYVASTHHIWGGIAWPLAGGDWGLGVSISNFGFGDQPVYTEDNFEGTGETYSVSETAIGITGSFQFSDRFSVGLTGRYVNESLANTTAAGFTVDFGTNYHTEVAGRPIRASFVVVNFGLSFQPEGPTLNTDVDPIEGGMGAEPSPGQFRTSAAEPPTQFRVGVAYDVLAAVNSRVTLLSEFWQPNDSDPGYGLAAEYAVNLGSSLSAAARGSYAYQGDNAETDPDAGKAGFGSSLQDDAKWDGLSLGGGLAWKAGAFNLGLDYTYRHLGILPGVNMFSVKLGW
ncbi:MAG: PorV/PorQ family protein [Gemmatimonadetes bacterium]|nr:PorV/PorQ family protein [Gemmatimonadota bacterium]